MLIKNNLIFLLVRQQQSTGNYKEVRIDYNTRKPHNSIGNLTPNKYTERYRNLII
jgi:transposase InsO family protein